MQELEFVQSTGGTRSNHTKKRRSTYTPSVDASVADQDELQLDYVQTMDALFGEDHDVDSDGASLRYEYTYICQFAGVNIILFVL